MLRFAGPVLAAAFLTSGAASADDGPIELRLEYGVTLALGGDLDEAEQVLSPLLTPGPYEAAAWSNLGNVHLLRGEADVALDLYDRAIELDSENAGVFLNRAVARLMLGDAEGSRRDAARAMTQAGGMDNALELLGIESGAARLPADEVDQAVLLSEEDIRALLGDALTEVPAAADTVSADEGVGGEERTSGAVWRAAGTRATGGTEIARVLYWQY